MYTEHDFQCAIVGNYNGSSHLAWSCTFAIEWATGNDPAQVAGNIMTAWSDVFGPLQSDNVGYTRATARRLSDGTVYELPVSLSATGTGTLYNPSNVAVVYTHYTLGAPAVKGRFFVPYLMDTVVSGADPSVWDSTTHALYDDSATDFKSALYGLDDILTFAVNSRKLSTVYGVTVSSMNNTPGQMGKRRYG